MNINNIEKAAFIKDRIDDNNISLTKIDEWLEKYPNGDSDGKTKLSDKKLYNIYLQEYKDGSGVNSVDLCGSLIQTELLQAARELLSARIKADRKLIDEL